MEVEMKGQKKLCLAVLVAALLLSWGCSENTNSPASSSSGASESIQPFLGRWDLTINTPKQDRPSWVQISEEQGQAKGLMTGFWGHAIPTGKIQVSDSEIEFAAPKGGGYSDGMRFKGKLTDGRMAGTVTNPKGVAWQWTGQRAPSLEREGTPNWGKPIRLFNGRNLYGWRLRNPKLFGASNTARWLRMRRVLILSQPPSLKTSSCMSSLNAMVHATAACI